MKNGKLAAERVFGINAPLRPRMARAFSELAADKADVLLLAGDSSRLPLPDGSIDAVVTDPPYFDNVNYSELADFFYAWLRLGLPKEMSFKGETSRNPREVQGRDSNGFAELLGDVFRESARVLKRNGTLAFTFHHSREEAWEAVARAIERADLHVVAAHPIKAEMSVAMPKTQAKNPINLDLIIVCKHNNGTARSSERGSVADAVNEARGIAARFKAAGATLSKGDLRVIMMGGFLKLDSATPGGGDDASRRALIEEFTAQIEPLAACQREAPARTSTGRTGRARQLSLSFDAES
ncbi:hypothetical protein HY251_18355 [bacterium]|nr:hypothetical protein [bacterium]